MESLYADFLKKNFQFSPELLRTLAENVKIHSVPKGGAILREGENGLGGFVILKGCVRSTAQFGVEERNLNFYLDGDPVIVQFDLNTKLASHSLIALEKTYFTTASEEEEKQMLATFPELKDTCLEMGNYFMQVIQQQHLESQTQNPEQRYVNLQKNRPEILQRVPQYHIANYLGITPETLSRIRKRLVS